ncbi:hypothetical protein SDC9_102671 [bioreactor metagenome]|uniref:Uncharacterized protein n=1 Tax=bioreactor metagenome TaxID=1076179 RepID=A0A645AYC1_9ZZZZ
MKAIFFILLSVLINTEALSQKNNLRNETADLITSVLLIRDINPTEQQESDTINELFEFSLAHYLERKGFEELVIKKAFQFLYRNGSSEYSDSPEERSMRSRRALCFASIALLSKSENRLTFIDYSHFSMMGSFENPNISLLEERLLGLLWLKILIKKDNKALTKTDLQKIEEYINLQSDNLSPSIKEKTNHLIKTYSTNIK